MKIKLILIILILLLLCGCSSKKCTKSHIENKIMQLPNSSGKLKIRIIPVSICDKWEEDNEK